MNTVLMIAFHFPPFQQSSGIQRTLKFATYLREYGWRPIVLTVQPRAYSLTADDQLQDVPKDIVVHRAFALDAKRHFSIMGRHLSFLARPDRYSTWLLGGIPAGLRLIRHYRPKVIWSTYPIATAQLLGYLLHRISGLPWVADLRDPMIDKDFPVDISQRRWNESIERRIVKRASKIILTTPSAKASYAAKYPNVPKDRWAHIPNGYDESIFAEVERSQTNIDLSRNQHPIHLVHSGILYPDERNPTSFFKAIGQLRKEGSISTESFRVTLRATGHDDLYEKSLLEHEISDIVSLASPISYRDALTEMLDADGLLLFQSASCNQQVPAKLYEYLRAQRPVFALTDEAGDTAKTLHEAKIGTIAPLDDAAAIKNKLLEFVSALRTGTANSCDPAIARRYSRKELTNYLAKILSELASL
jgi:glycosyltransferase involved in cell wall biosynthesis